MGYHQSKENRITWKCTWAESEKKFFWKMDQNDVNIAEAEVNSRPLLKH